MLLNQLMDNQGANKKRKRVGRGIGSGKGKTGGRGVKGQKSRSGVAIKGFEGGQMPLYQRLPKRGFNNVSSKDIIGVNLSRLQKAFDAKKLDAKKVIDADALVKSGVISKIADGVKILAKGKITTKADFSVLAVSVAARVAIEQVGGSVVLPEVAKPIKGKRWDRREKAAKKRMERKS